MQKWCFEAPTVEEGEKKTEGDILRTPRHVADTAFSCNTLTWVVVECCTTYGRQQLVAKPLKNVVNGLISETGMSGFVLSSVPDM
ncbi:MULTISPECIES: hypothetical protein [Methylocaldum]|jgi:hypothetical protein|uniref:hypothetical protein n=1 Tax=unclassified Methylocaldum TaxID=2622260 RepID=UPI00111C4017|nr:MULTISPECIES: hypothetical protein [unclassified Methylocaldum]MBP1150658.1 hypothetical protein [Methylocaldum sp. RMAD-M]MVF22358.1 hypothetical protein [Methylocaldum sp. BRCS4]